MRNMRNVTRLLTVVVVILSLHGNLFSQSSNRAIRRVSIPNEPIEIRNLRVLGKNIQYGQSFAANEDWVKGLTIDVLNTSDKVITNLKIALNVPVIGGVQHHVANLGARYNGRIEPNKTIQLVMGQNLERIVAFLAKDNLTIDLSVAELRVMVVEFEDGTIWSQGKMLRKDPNNPAKLIPVSGSILTNPNLLRTNHSSRERSKAKMQWQHCKDVETLQIDCTIPDEPETNICGTDIYDRIGYNFGYYSSVWISEECGWFPGCPIHTYQSGEYNPCYIG
jgi:hypothetical protein